MFIADDIVLFPFKSILNVFREIYNAAIQELTEEAAAIRAELSRLYLMLEGGTIDEAEFDERERVLLDRLDVLESKELELGSDDDDEDDDDDDEEDDEDLEEDESSEDTL